METQPYLCTWWKPLLLNNYTPIKHTYLLCLHLVQIILLQVRDEYSFVLTLTDGHLGEGNFITQSFLLLVEDVNDNEPIFKPYPSAITVKEGAPPSVLTTVEATDLDEGAYGQVFT